jgi:hypothetical protein
MATANKTKPEKTSVSAYIEAVENDTRRADAKALLKLMKEITGEKPVMWGPSLIGFGNYHYKYESGREGDAMRIGFSPRSANMVLYLLAGWEGEAALLKKLGKHKTGVSCLYINKLADVDMAVLREMITRSLAYMNKKYQA